MSANTYEKWQQRVFNKDNRKCIFCAKENNLTADHILPLSKYPKLKYDTNNGRTLCEDCRKKDSRKDGSHRFLRFQDVEYMLKQNKHINYGKPYAIATNYYLVEQRVLAKKEVQRILNMVI